MWFRPQSVFSFIGKCARACVFGSPLAFLQYQYQYTCLIHITHRQQYESLSLHLQVSLKARTMCCCVNQSSSSYRQWLLQGVFKVNIRRAREQRQSAGRQAGRSSCFSREVRQSDFTITSCATRRVSISHTITCAVLLLSFLGARPGHSGFVEEEEEAHWRVINLIISAVQSHYVDLLLFMRLSASNTSTHRHIHTYNTYIHVT